MKLAILETITTPGGHEVDFDRILVEEWRQMGHEVIFYVPEEKTFPIEYHVPIRYLRGRGISYTGRRGLNKLAASFTREWRRQGWFRQMARRASAGEFDAIVIPTSTYRYMRALGWNSLKNSPVPVVLILHGINPKEAPAFFREAETLAPYSNIRMAVLNFSADVLGRAMTNVHCMPPPVFTPRDLEEGAEKPASSWEQGRVLRLGFFGQYRREKRLDDFLDGFLAGTYDTPVRLLIQGATMRPEDSEDFERIIAKYQGDPRIEFLHKGLFGREWQEAIAGVDALLMPYSAARYRYHWGGMLFTAIGYQKPVIASDEMNPEVLAEYDLGGVFAAGNTQSLQQVVTEFINTFPAREERYRQELCRAYERFSPRQFAAEVARLCKKSL